MANTIKNKLFRWTQGGITYYQTLPDYNVSKELTRVNDPQEAKDYIAKLRGMGTYVPGSRTGPQFDVQSVATQTEAELNRYLSSPESDYVSEYTAPWGEKLTMVPKSQIQAIEAEQAKVKSGELVQVGTRGSANVPIYAPKGMPIPGSGTYIEDTAKKYDTQLKTQQVPKNIEDQWNALQQRIATEGVTDASGRFLIKPTQSTTPTQTTPTGAPGASSGGSTPTPTPTLYGTSAQARADLRNLLTGGQSAPTQFKSVEYYDQLRKDKGVVEDENELDDIRKQADLIKQDLRMMSQQTGELSLGGYTGKMSERERGANFKLEGLAIRENAVLNRLKTKNSYISTMVNLRQQDYNEAKQAYDTTFNQNLQIEQFLNKEQDQAKQDSKASLNTMTTLMSNKGISYSELSPSVQTQISTLELQSGLPQGFTQSVFENADKPIQTTIISDDKTTATIVYKDGTTKQINTGIRTGIDTGGLSVQNWADLIIKGQAKITDVPNPKGSTLRTQVINAIQNSGQAILSDKDREKLSVLDTAYNVYNTIKDLSEKINNFGPAGRIAGWLGRYVGGGTQWNTDIARYNAARQGFVSNVARTLGEKGTLAEGDVQRAISNLPSVNDTRDVAEGKLSTLKNILDAARSSIIQKSTKPVSGLSEGTLNNQITQPDGSIWKQNADGSYTRIK
jgi:hypothetical protein